LLFCFKGSFFPETQAPSATLYLDKGDDLHLVRDATTHIKRAQKSKTIQTIQSAFYINGIEWELFEKENKQEVVKDSLLGNLKLVF
jgi:hypothetical protein